MLMSGRARVTLLHLKLGYARGGHGPGNSKYPRSMSALGEETSSGSTLVLAVSEAAESYEARQSSTSANKRRVTLPGG